MKELLKLYLVFAKIGVLTFGGGYAMLPMLQKELIEKRSWVSDEELMDYFAIGQCTPGVIAVNTATFVGYKLRGVAGACFSTLGVISPSIAIILIIAAFISNFATYDVIIHAFAGIRVCVCVLIFFSVVKLAKKSLVSKLTIAVYITVTLLALFSDIATVFLVLGAGLFGVVLTLIKAKRGVK